jgi:hypothetical protein
LTRGMGGSLPRDAVVALAWSIKCEVGRSISIVSSNSLYNLRSPVDRSLQKSPQDQGFLSHRTRSHLTYWTCWPSIFSQQCLRDEVYVSSEELRCFWTDTRRASKDQNVLILQTIEVCRAKSLLSLRPECYDKFISLYV